MATLANTMTAYMTDSAGPMRPGPLTRLYRTVVLWNAARQTRDELMKLNDRELNDIGLHRSQIDSIARDIWHG